MRIQVDKDSCVGCMECVEACAQAHFNTDDPKKAALRIIKDGQNFIPVVCDQCGECAKACPTGVIEKANGKPYIVNKDECMLCSMCVGACPKKLLPEPSDLEAMFKCDLCLKCTEVCPNEALIAVE